MNPQMIAKGRAFWLRKFVAVLGLIGLLQACSSLPTSGKDHRIRLYSRGINKKEIAILDLYYIYEGFDSPNNYFYSSLYTIPEPIEKIQVPQSSSVGPKSAAKETYYLAKNGRSYLKIQGNIPAAHFEGALIYKLKTRQDFRNHDDRMLEHLILISFSDAAKHILALDFYRFPSHKGYLLRVDLRPADDFYRRIPVGTPANQVANILSDSEYEALFHNQTLVGAPQFN